MTFLIVNLLIYLFFSRLRIIYDSNLRFFLSQLLYEKSLKHTLHFESHEKRMYKKDRIGKKTTSYQISIKFFSSF